MRGTIVVLPVNPPGREGISHAGAFACAQMFALDFGLAHVQGGRVSWRIPPANVLAYWNGAPAVPA